MKISYNKFHKLMIDNQINRQDLMRVADISSSVATKFNKDETVSMEVFMRICKVFHGDICQIIEDWYGSSDRMGQVWGSIADRCL